MDVLGLLMLLFGAGFVIGPLAAVLLRLLFRLVLKPTQDTPAFNLLLSLAAAMAGSILFGVLSSLSEVVVLLLSPLLLVMVAGWLAGLFWFFFGLVKKLPNPVDPKVLRSWAFGSGMLGLVLLLGGTLTCSMGPAVNFH